MNNACGTTLWLQYDLTMTFINVKLSPEDLEEVFESLAFNLTGTL